MTNKKVKISPYRKIVAMIEELSNYQRHQARIADRFKAGKATRKDWKRIKRNDRKARENS